MLKIFETDIEKLDSDIPIARYFSASKLKKIIDNETLWFSNANEFPDNYERTLPNNIYWYNKAVERIARKISSYQKQKYEAYISCWTKFESENYALWKIYDRYSNGACLVTTVGKLRAQLPKDIILGKVVYIPASGKCAKVNIPMVSMKGTSNYIVTDFLKIEPYSYESEIRAVFYDADTIKGQNLKIDLKELVQEVYISPFSCDERVEKTKKLLLQKFDINIIKESAISQKNK